MFKWVHTVIHAEGRARWVYIQYLVYLLAILASTVYAYARLDFVRSKEIKEEKAIENL